MISVTPQGRLGNQLFQYAFVYSLSKRLGTPFLIHRVPGDEYVLMKYFRLRGAEQRHQTIGRLNYLVRRVLFGIPKRLEQTGWDPVDKILDEAIHHTSANWYGFFQSVAYFKPYQQDIRALFTPLPVFQNGFMKKYGSLLNGKKKIAVIHLRRTDYLTWGSERLGGVDMTLPMTYYENCLRMISLSEYHTIVLSDDINFCKDYFKSTPGLFFESNDEITDLQLMTNADLVVISNSTFAWWGAFLNNRNAKVLAPQYWLGFKVEEPYPIDIMKDLDWTWVDVKK